MAKYLIAVNDSIVKTVEAKNIKQAVLGIGVIGDYTVYTLQSDPRSVTVREVVQFAVEVVGGEEE